jgi:hypothetical protein
MVDTNGTGSSQEDFGADPQSYRDEASNRPTDPSHDRKLRGNTRWNASDELR